MVAEIQLVSAREFARRPERQAFAELIGGEIVVSPSPTPRHDIVVSNLKDALRAGAVERGLGHWYQAPLDLFIDGYDVLQPDLMVFALGDEPDLDDLPVHNVPVLVVEVLSPGSRSRDIREKLPRYASRGIAEFWVVDPVNRTITIQILDEYGIYHPHIAGRSIIGVGVYAELSLELDQIFP